LTPKLSWNNELQIVKFYPNKKETGILDAVGLANKIKGYWFSNIENYEGKGSILNPYAQYGFQLTNMINEPSYHFASMVVSAGTEMQLRRLKRGFMQVNYSLGYGSKAKNYMSFQYGISFNFEEKRREGEYNNYKETEYKLAKMKLEFEKYRIQAIQDSISRASRLKNVNNDLMESQALTDSLSKKTVLLINELKICKEDIKWTKDSLDSATLILGKIYIKQWHNFE